MPGRLGTLMGIGPKAAPGIVAMLACVIGDDPPLSLVGGISLP